LIFLAGAQAIKLRDSKDSDYSETSFVEDTIHQQELAVQTEVSIENKTKHNERLEAEDNSLTQDYKEKIEKAKKNID